MCPDGGDVLFVVNDVCKFVHQRVIDRIFIYNFEKYVIISLRLCVKCNKSCLTCGFSSLICFDVYNNNNNNNQAVHTDREVTANRPDIIKNRKEKTCTLIDVAISADRNVVQKEAEKKLKYKSLCVEIQQMWNLKCTIIPVIIETTGIVTRSLKKNLEAVAGKYSTDSLQKTAILGTPHVIRKVLQCEA